MERYYARFRFADLFGNLTRAPNHIGSRMRDIPGVANVQTRIVRPVLLDMPGLIEPASCQLVSLGNDSVSELNQVVLRRGRFPNPFGTNEVIASETIADAHRLRPGDVLHVTMEGRKELLHIVGVGISPEYIYATQPGLLIADDRRYGILWMPTHQMEAAFNMEGAFNSFSLALIPGTSASEVIFQVDRILKPYGGRGAFTRKDQESHRRVSDEMHQMRSMAYVTPSIFLAVSAFLFNIVLSRLVNQQKDQIATLRAFGYTSAELAIHYLKFVSILVVLGVTLGLVGGWRLSWWLTDLYSQFFRFPFIEYQLARREAFFAVAVGFVAAVLGGFQAIRRVIKLQPAVAMRPDSPRAYSGSLLDRIGPEWVVSPMARMVMRRLEANLSSTALSILGIAMGVAIFVLGTFMRGTIDFVFNAQFELSQRQDVTLTFNESLSAHAIHDVCHLPGVLRAEPFRSVAVRLHHGSQRYRLGLTGLESDPELFRVLDSKQRPVLFKPGSGVTISDKLAEILSVRVGDMIDVEVLETNQPIRRIQVGAIFSNFTDPAAYLNRHDLHRLLAEGEQLSGVHLEVDSTQMDDLYREVKQIPAVAGVLDIGAARVSFRKLISAHISYMQLANAIFGSIIAFGVIYNTALITFVECGRDLATLRVIGFSRREVSTVLIGELAVLTFCAIPIGLSIGYAFSYLATKALDTETHRFPLVVNRDTFAYAVVVILVAATVSSVVVRRMLDRLDLLAVLKVKES